MLFDFDCDLEPIRTMKHKEGVVINLLAVQLAALLAKWVGVLYAFVACVPVQCGATCAASSSGPTLIALVAGSSSPAPVLPVSLPVTEKVAVRIRAVLSSAYSRRLPDPPSLPSAAGALHEAGSVR